MNCPACGFENRENAGFCGECGASLLREIRCASCQRSNPPGRKFCDGCGQRLVESAAQAPDRIPRDYTPKHLADKILQSKSALEGERKQVTVLFADVKGSLELAEQVDPEEWHRILDRFFQILASGVHRFEGTVNQYTGDGIMALFGAPIAHENHAQRACYAALHLREELRRYADELRRTKALSFSVRMGMNSGEVVVGKIGDDLRMDYTAQGQTVGLAQRIEQLAPPESVYLTDHTARLVEGFFELRDLGPFELRGVREPLPVYELEGIGRFRTRLELSRSRGFSRFVGRADEMTNLELALRRTLEGNGQAVGVVGEAGVGKSRLCLEFVERCRAKGITVEEAHCPAHGKAVPFLPALELMRGTFAIAETDNGQLAREKIAGRLLLLDRGFEEALPIVFDFLGVAEPERPLQKTDPELRQRQLFAFVQRLVQARSTREPAVILIDDLHWIDAASDALLAQLVEAVNGTRTLLLVNFRPEYQADWTRKSYYQQLPLVPLGGEAISELLLDLLGSDASLVTLAQLIRERTAGNPFFIEEVVQSLAESGSLEGQKGDYRLVTPLERIEVPSTVQSLVAGRIDRLPEREKQLLQTAAVIGKEFGEPVLELVAALPRTDLLDSLAVLTRAEFVYQKALYPVAEYAFKHPLTQEVALQSQLQERRCRTHAAVARALEKVYRDRLDELAALIAEHWEEAEEALEAARWHRRAARRTGAHDPSQALPHWHAVRRLIRGLTETDETARLGLDAASGMLTQALFALGSSADYSEIFAEGRELAERIGDNRTLALLHASWVGLLVLSGCDEFDADAEAAKRAARAARDAALELAVESRLCFWHQVRDGPTSALPRLDAAIEAAPADPSVGAEFFWQSPLARLHIYRGYSEVAAGRLADAQKDFETGLRLVDESGGDPQGRMPATVGFQMVAETRGDSATALRYAHRGLELAQELGLPYWLKGAYLNLASAQQQAGDPRAAVRAAEKAEEYPSSRRMPVGTHAEALYELGQPERALETAAAEAAADKLLARPALSPALVLTRLIMRAEGAAGAAQVERILAEVESHVQARGTVAFLPFIACERAELARLLGAGATRERELREAHRLFTEMGATGHAEQLARELGL